MMCDTYAFNHFYKFQFNGFCTRVIEQSDSIAKQAMYQTDLHLVKQSGL